MLDLAFSYFFLKCIAFFNEVALRKMHFIDAVSAIFRVVLLQIVKVATKGRCRSWEAYVSSVLAIL